MTDPLVSQDTFKWILTIATGGLAGTWFFYDGIKLIRLRNSDGKDPTIRDKRFGYVMGMMIGAIGVWGCLRFHGVV